MRFETGILILFASAAVTGRTDETGAPANEGTVRMHASPFAPDSHAPAGEEKTHIPSIRNAPARTLSSSSLDIPSTLPPPDMPDASRERDLPKQENWITPSSQATKEQEELQPSGWGWLADEASRKLLAKEQEIRDSAASDEDKQSETASAWRKEDESGRDSAFFINNDYFNNASVFDTSSRFDAKDKDSAESQSGDSGTIKPVVYDRSMASSGKEARDMTSQEPDEKDRGYGLTTAPSEVGLPSPEDRTTISQYGFRPEYEMPRDNKPVAAVSSSSFEPRSSPSSIRIPLPSDRTPASFGSLTKPASFTEPAGNSLPGTASRIESPLARSSFEQPQGFRPAAAASPVSGGLPAPSAGSSMQKLYDSREESGMKLLPR